MWVASCDYTGDMSIGPRALELAAGKLQRFRVLFKFLLGNLEAAPPSLKEVGAIPREDLSLVRARWLALAVRPAARTSC